MDAGITTEDETIQVLDAFIATMHAVRCDFSIEPRKEHIATCINYSDLLEMREEFVRELTNTITAFVYSEQKQAELVAAFRREGRSPGAAWAHLISRSHQKFRRDSLQGQFSELLLCNLLQYYFKAQPLLRKMPITTNPKKERNGVDALHVAKISGRHVLYIGEAKTYNREKDALKLGMVDAIRDVMGHYKSHRNELTLYTYDDFVPKELESLAQEYIAGTRQLEVQLVCIVTYDEKSTPSGLNRAELLDQTIEAVKAEVAATSSHPVFKEVPPALLPRMNYIVFPLRGMADVIEAFTNRIQHA